MTVRAIPPSGKKLVYLVDSHPLVREWLTYLLDQEPDLTVCGHAASATSALRGIASCSPHVIIMDLTFEDGSGLDLIERVLLHLPTTAVLVLSAHDASYYADRVLRAGAKGYISKNEPTRKIVAALRCVLQGKVYLNSVGVQLLIGNRAHAPAHDKARKVETLSDRELEVFAMLGRGLGPRRIAAMLHVSPKTIHTYCARIKGKLQLRDANELLREAICWIEKAADYPAKSPRNITYRSPVGVIGLSEQPAAGRGHYSPR